MNFPKFYLLFELTQLCLIPYIFSLIWTGNNRAVKIAGGKRPDGKSREGKVRVGNDWAAERLDPGIKLACRRLFIFLGNFEEISR